MVGSVADIPLFLPSAVMLGHGPCAHDLLEIEWKLRASQGLDTLENLRKYLLSRTAISKYKQRYTHGQYDMLRSSRAIETVNAKIGACAARYRLHRTVLLQTSPLLNLVGSELLFKELQEQDIRGIERDAMDAELERTTSLSWIWMGAGIDLNNQDTINECAWSP